MSAADPALPYRETLLPRWWVWLLPIAFAGLLGLAYGTAYTPAAGWFVAAATGLLLVGAMVLGTRTRISVDSAGIRAGRASLPAQFIGKVRPLDADGTFRARTAAADPRAYLVLRTWAAETAVVLEVTDPDDPHPYWLISTRRPQQLADALVAARAHPSTG